MTSDLITRLSKLDAPDREVDARIWCEVHGVVYVDHYALMHETQVFFKEKGKRKEQVSGGDRPHAAFYTASVDAATALAERVLPGWYWGITQGDDGEDAVEFQGNVWPSIQPYPAELEQYGYHKFPAIALLIALLRAKEASK
ncbi:hypothetical protein [Brucella intermedia]|uniref:hypothetical protein n=1 Tax=Brucella intermedia TaxID=94625 RepID=UPI0015914C6A|nr:hypothetical protein [Brucella intermedia]